MGGNLLKTSAIVLILCEVALRCLHVASKKPETEEASVQENEASNATLSIVRWELHRFHTSNILLLERDCYIEDCSFERAKAIIGDTIRATRYWNFVNCAKYGNTCPRHGQWGEWSEYGPCSARCAVGVHIRWRQCNSPHTMYEGVYCEGSDHERAPCHFDEGPKCALNPAIPGVWSEWGKWSHCSGDPGEAGFSKRQRRCLPNNITSECEAYPEETLQCRKEEFNVDGAWDTWEPWTTCNTKFTCGTGVHTRRRKCSKPYVSGKGQDCLGSSSETKECPGTPCDELATDIAHFVEGSYIRYKPVSLAHYLNIFVKFLPNSDSGLIFQYSTLSGLHAATSSGSVKIKNPKIHAFVNVNQKKDKQIEAKVEVIQQMVEVEDYVYATLFSEEDLLLNVSINGSDPVVMSMKGIKHGQWNEFRVTIVSDMVWARLNDGENHEGRLRAYLKFEEVVQVNDSSRFTQMVGTVSNPVYDKLKSLVIPEYRSVFGEFTGEVGLGKVRGGHRSFRGYISHLKVNFNRYTFRLKPKSEISRLWDPQRVDLVNYGRGRLSRLAEMSRFNGRESVEIPLVASWIKDAPPRQPLGKLRNEMATFEFVLKPECEEGVFFLMQGAVNRFTHWKLSVEEFRKVRLAMSYGGDITILKSKDDLRTGEWNRVVFQLVRKGEAQLDVNGHVYSASLPVASATHYPSPIVHVGGFGKPISHDEILGEHPSKAALDQARSFEGYIYSFRQNHRLYVLQKHPQTNTFHMYSSMFTNKSPTRKVYYFLPSEDEKAKDAGKRIHESAREWEKDSDKRALSCLVPLPVGGMDFPNVTWYRNDQRVKNSARMWVRTFSTQKSHSSVLYFGDSLDSSPQYAGIYHCVMSYHGSTHIIATYVAAIVSDDITHFGTGGLGWIFRGYSIETSILIIAASAISGVLSLLMLLSCIRFIIRKIRGDPKKPVESDTSEDERGRFEDVAYTAHGAHTFKSKLKRRAKQGAFARAKLLRKNVKKEVEQDEKRNLLGKKKFGDKFRNKRV